MNAFSAGSSADISEQNIDLNTGMLNKQSSKQNLTKNNGFMHMSGMGGTVAGGMSGSTSAAGIG